MNWRENNLVESTKIKRVLPHAIARFRERTGCKKDNGYIAEKLLQMVDLGSKAEFTQPKYELMALLNSSNGVIRIPPL